MTTQNGRAFNEWLRAQLKAKKMSQRQLAQQSGVDHSTISRLIRGDRMPSLGTATKLARGLREIREDADAAQYLGLVVNGTQNPTARVEYALRADEALTEAQVRQIMEYYLAVRMRRFGRVFQSAENGPRQRPPPDRADHPTTDGLPVLAAVGDGPAGRRRDPNPGHIHVDAHHRAGSQPVLTSLHYGPDALHVRVSGTANAGVRGAGVRDSPGMTLRRLAPRRAYGP